MELPRTHERRACQEFGLVSQVARIASELVGTMVSVDAPVMSVGLDSIGATELSSRLGNRLSVELP